MAQYPTLARIARDYLAIQGSAVSSERAFSCGGRTGTKEHNQLSPQTIEALQILKDAYRTGLMSSEIDIVQKAKKPWSIE